MYICCKKVDIKELTETKVRIGYKENLKHEWLFAIICMLKEKVTEKLQET